MLGGLLGGGEGDWANISCWSHLSLDFLASWSSSAAAEVVLRQDQRRGGGGGELRPDGGKGQGLKYFGNMTLVWRLDWLMTAASPHYRE